MVDVEWNSPIKNSNLMTNQWIRSYIRRHRLLGTSFQIVQKLKLKWSDWTLLDLFLPKGTGRINHELLECNLTFMKIQMLKSLCLESCRSRNTELGTIYYWIGVGCVFNMSLSRPGLNRVLTRIGWEPSTSDPTLSFLNVFHILGSKIKDHNGLVIAM